MYYISSAKIEGFWGNKTIEIPFDSQMNFLIGVNGSGKTTIINIIASVLNFDLKSLARFKFKKVRVEFKNIDKSKLFQPYVELFKEDNERRHTYKLKYKHKENPLEAKLDLLEDEDNLYGFLKHKNKRFLSDLFYSDKEKLISELGEVINISWLSIHRHDSLSDNKRELSYLSTIDRKLEDLSTKFIRHYSILQSKLSEQNVDFQKYIFLSLLDDPNKDYALISNINLEKQEETIKDIFSEFQIPKTKYTSKLIRHIKSSNEAVSKFKNKINLSPKDLTSLNDIVKIESVIDEWRRVKKEQGLLLKNMSSFLEVINNLFNNNKIIISKYNDLRVKRDDDGDEFKLQELSSGEKQLVIIMIESLLQDSKSHVFIADEPELSLHIEWQEKLVDSILKINPNTQIIFATHSPDVVAGYSKKIIDIQKVTN